MKKIRGSKEAKIYTIDENYRIMYYNQALKTVFPELELNDICYKVLCAEESPCPECPLGKKENDSAIFYNKKVQKWVEINTGVVEDGNNNVHNMIIAKEIHEGNKNLFYNLTSLSSYDELFELNTTTDSYKILYHKEEKYILPDTDGKLGEMLEDMSQTAIHPEDREAFWSFWNLNDIFQRIGRMSSGKTLAGEFRNKNRAGGYTWIRHIVVPLQYSEKDDKIIMCFIQDIDEQKKREKIIEEKVFLKENILDMLTGLYKKPMFFAKCAEFLISHGSEKCCLMAVDIEHFKIFNEWYGTGAGDSFLRSIAAQLQMVQDQKKGVAGYIGDDDFAILLLDEQELIEELQNKIMGYVKKYGGNAGFLPAFGIYKIEDKSISVSTMYDRALIALASVKGNYTMRVGWFDDRMMQQIEERHKLLSEVQRALENNEFTFYAQPKCNMMTGKIIGMESLVRWNHPEKGLVPPGEFIPLLEEYGFITNLDLYIWDKVCASVRDWIDKGNRAIPISVNVSRMDLYTLDLADCFSELTEKYKLDPKLIEIEITESAYVEEYGKIRGTVERLRSAGFTVLMDDFGSGYSSLNMLKDVNVDILKIDMKFLEMDEESAEKGFSILEAIISMAGLIGIRVIAEGVETKEQVDFLLNMGCNYAQGYYFYRPMPIHMFEEFLADENNVDYRGIMAREVEGFRIKDLLNQNVFSEAMLDKILGGVAFYDMYEGQLELVRVNEQYYRVTGTNPVDLEEKKKLIIEDIYEEDREKVLNIFKRADRNLLDGSEGTVRRLRDSGEIIWVKLHVFFLKEQNGHRMYYASINDITEQKKREAQLEASQRALAAVVNISENDESFMKLEEENRRAAASIFAQMTPGGMIGGYCEENFPLYFANNEMVKLLGYDDYQEFSQAIHGKVINTIHPEDRERVYTDIGPAYYPGLEYTTMYRMPKKDGTWFWSLDKGKVIRAKDGRLAIISACTDISETMIAQQQLIKKNAQLLEQNQELKFLNNDMPGGYYRCANTREYDFIYISQRFLDIFGYTRDEINELFHNKFIRMVHPEDRKKLQWDAKNMSQDKETKSFEYRMLGKKGYIWVIDQARYMSCNGGHFTQGMVMDVTQTVEERSRMRMYFKHTPENIILVTYKGEDVQYFTLANGLFRELGYPVENYTDFLKSGKHLELVSDEDMERFRKKRKEAVRKKKDFQEVFKSELFNGKEFWIKMDCRFVTENENGVIYLCIYSDMTNMKRKEEDLFLAGKEIESLMELTEINGWEWDMQEHTLTLSNMYHYGLSEYKIAEKEVIEGFPETAAEKFHVHADYRCAFLKYFDDLRSGRTNRCEEGVFLFIDKNKQPVWYKIAGESICSQEGRIIKAVGYYLDITKQKNQELQLIKMAERDALTGLQNRQTSIPRIKEYLADMGDESSAIIMLDMDNFKLANDVFGHAYGDALIACNAKKLKGFFRGDDIVCRIGGDEFLVLCKGIKAADVEKKLATIVKEMITVRSDGIHEVLFSLSAGYVMIPEQGKEFDELYRKADVALFAAKMDGKSSYRRYRENMKEIRFELADRKNEK